MLEQLLKRMAPNIKYCVSMINLNLPLMLQEPNKVYDSSINTIDVLKKYFKYEVVSINEDWEIIVKSS